MEDNNKYNLNENSSAKKTFRTLGPILLIAGILMIIISLASFFNGDMSYGFLPFLGIPLVFVGFVMTILGYMSTINRYTASQTAPVAKDVTNYILDNTKESIGAVANEIGKNLSHPKDESKACPYCNELMSSSAKFCDNCGKPLFKTCESCQSVNDLDAKFCQSCGAKLV